VQYATALLRAEVEEERLTLVLLRAKVQGVTPLVHGLSLHAQLSTPIGGTHLTHRLLSVVLLVLLHPMPEPASPPTATVARFPAHARAQSPL
jgi:hypothetical protein